MRVLHLASGREWRGGQRQTQLLVTSLAARAGSTQTVVTSRRGELARRLAGTPIRLRGIGWTFGLDPRAFAAGWREAATADLIHAHDAHAMAVAALASGRTGRPLVVTRRMARPLRRPALWRRATTVIAISEAVRRQLERDGIPSDRIVVIPPAIDLDAVRRTSPLDWPDRMGWPQGTPVAVAAAALTSEKGLDVLVEAAASLHPRRPDLQWVVMGEGPERSTLESLIRARSASGFVHLIGHQPDPLPGIAGAAVLVLPSREEGFGTTILDALALGTPVVASAAGGISEALAHGGGVMVAPGDVPALAEAVATVTGNAQLAARLGEAGRQAAERFGLRPMVEQVERVYRSCLQELIGK